MSSSPSIPILRSIHWLAHRAFTRAGYRWELRRSGELKLGLWRKTLRKPQAGSSQLRLAAPPKRLVLVPGFGDTPLSWLVVLGLLKPLARGRFDEVVIFDFPGYSGFLSGERPFHSMDLLRTALGDAMDSLRPHTIVGHSLGGWLAASYTASCGRGERATGFAGPSTLVLCNASGVSASPEAEREFERKFRATMSEGFEVLRPHLFEREPRWFRWIASEFSRFVSDPDIQQFMLSIRPEHLMTAQLGDIRSRVWLVWGERDSLSPPSGIAAWQAGLTAAGEAKAVLIRGAGHSPQVERPAVTAAVLSQIFAERAPHRMGSRWWKLA